MMRLAAVSIQGILGAFTKLEVSSSGAGGSAVEFLWRRDS
jgi:hypothetical protein